MYEGGRPFCTAAAYTIGLNVEPGWRSACVARLNFESSKSRPPTMARTAPLRGSIATNAPWRYGEFAAVAVLVGRGLREVLLVRHVRDSAPYLPALDRP